MSCRAINRFDDKCKIIFIGKSFLWRLKIQIDDSSWTYLCHTYPQYEKVRQIMIGSMFGVNNWLYFNTICLLVRLIVVYVLLTLLYSTKIAFLVLKTENIEMTHAFRFIEHALFFSDSKPVITQTVFNLSHRYIYNKGTILNDFRVSVVVQRN